MKIKKTKIPGVCIIIPYKIKDKRGYFQRLFCKELFKKANLENSIVQINSSFSKKKGTTRGLHYQMGSSAENKIIRCIQGSMVNVVVDLRTKSKTYLKHVKIKLSKKNGYMSVIPKGCANGMQTLENNTEIIYFVSNFYNPKKEKGISFYDPKLKIKLPLRINKITKKDLSWSFL